MEKKKDKTASQVILKIMRKTRGLTGREFAYKATQMFAIFFFFVLFIFLLMRLHTFKDYPKNKEFPSTTATYTNSRQQEGIDADGKKVISYDNYFEYELNGAKHNGSFHEQTTPATIGTTFTIHYNPSNPAQYTLYTSFHEAIKGLIPPFVFACILQAVAIILIVGEIKDAKAKKASELAYNQTVTRVAKKDFEHVDCGLNEKELFDLLEPQRLKIYNLKKRLEKIQRSIPITLPGPLVIITLIQIGIRTYLLNRAEDKLETEKTVFYTTYRQKIAEPLLRTSFPNYKYMPSQGISKKEIAELDIFAQIYDIHTEDYVEGTYKNISYHQSDLTMTRSGKDGTITLFSGRIGIYDYPKQSFEGHVVITAKKYSSVKLNGLERVQMENVYFNQVFDVYADLPHSAYYILTPHFMEHIIDLNAHGDLCIRFTGNKICILRDNVSGMFEPDFDSQLDISFEIDRSHYELKEIQQFIDTLALEGNTQTNIYSTNKVSNEINYDIDQDPDERITQGTTSTSKFRLKNI